MEQAQISEAGVNARMFAAQQVQARAEALLEVQGAGVQRRDLAREQQEVERKSLFIQNFLLLNTVIYYIYIYIYNIS